MADVNWGLSEAPIMTPRESFSMAIWRYILVQCKKMSDAEISCIAAVVLFAATSIWSGSLAIGAVLGLLIALAVLLTFPIWGVAVALVCWAARAYAERTARATNITACAPESRRRLPG